MDNKVDPQKVTTVLRFAITVLTAILGFFSGIGSAAAANHFGLF